MRNVRLGALLAMMAATFSLASGCSDDSSTPSHDGAGGNDDGTGGDGDAGAGGSGGDGGSGGSGGGEEQPGSVEILAKFGDVVVGGQTPMRALVRDHAGKVLGGRALVWASETPSVATVDPETGVVTGVGEGKATISVTSEGAEASVEVQVEPAVAEPSYLVVSGVPEYGECVLTRSGRVYCRNLIIDLTPGQAWSPIWYPIAPELRFKKIVRIGAEHALTLGLDGRLYHLPLYTLSSGLPKPTGLATEVRFKDVVATYAGSSGGTALSEDGRLYDVAHSPPFLPKLMPVDVEFSSISMSESHALALTEDGRVYSWASGYCRYNPEDRGYLGVPKKGGEHYCGVTEIETGVSFTSVTAGSEVSFGIDADGVAYAWGGRHIDYPEGSAGESMGMAMHGRGSGAEPSSTPLPLATNERFVRIVTARKQAAALRADGVPFFWGISLSGYDTLNTFYAPTEMPDARVASLSSSVLVTGFHPNSPLENNWGAFQLDGRLFLFGSKAGARRTYVDQELRYFDGKTPQLTLERGSRQEFVLQPFTEAETITANGLALPSGEIAPPLALQYEEPTTSGKLEHEGVSFELVPKMIRPGQAATILVVEASKSAALGNQQVKVGGASVDVWVAPPAPPPGTPLDLRCGMPESIVHGYWCLTNSGGATAPHKWKDLPLAGSTWHYQNLCISYGEGGLGAARFRSMDGDVTTKPIRYGVLSKANGEPEAGAGHWLLFHEGIGDPQVEQLSFNPSTGAVGESWPFQKGGCSF